MSLIGIAQAPCSAAADAIERFRRTGVADFRFVFQWRHCVGQMLVGRGDHQFAIRRRHHARQDQVTVFFEGGDLRCEQRRSGVGRHGYLGLFLIIHYLPTLRTPRRHPRERGNDGG